MRPGSPVKRSRARALPGVHLARLVGVGEDGTCAIAFAAPGALERVIPAASTGSLDPAALGSTVAVMFPEADSAPPVVLGVVARRSPFGPEVEPGRGPVRKVSLQIDAKRLVFDAEEEVVIRCGKATLTLTRDGKVAIRGAKVLSRASGANVIRGGSVQIN